MTRNTFFSACAGVFLMCFFCFGASLQAAIRYVKPTSSGSGNGSSWANASADFQAMINASAAGDEIWAAAGVYKPTNGTDRNVNFVMKEGVGIYGGFTGTETSRDQRNWRNNATVLSGDIGEQGNKSDNSYHIFHNNQNGLTNAAILDGFTLADANANGSAYSQTFGGGMFNNYVSPSIRNCTFVNNNANYGGALINAISAHSLVVNCVFKNNHANSFGGAIINGFAGNSSNSTVINCIFVGNSAAVGGGMSNESGSSPIITNCVFYDNSASITGGPIQNTDANPIITNCILWNNNMPLGDGFGAQSSISHSIIQGGFAGNNNLDTDPLFVNPDAGDFHLQPCSPAIDAGLTANAPVFDFDDQTRPFNASGAASAITDMGVYEFQSQVPAPSIQCINKTVMLGDEGSFNYLISNLAAEISGCGTEVMPALDNTLFFDCDDVGDHLVTLTVSDRFGQSASCQATVTVVDHTAPSINCPGIQALSISGASCAAQLQDYASYVYMQDNCGVQSITQSPAGGTMLSGIGTQVITLTATDVHNNTQSCTFSVNISDITPPVLVCRQGSVQLQGSQYTLTPNEVLDAASSSDNCGQVQVSHISPAQINCAQVGQNVQIQVTANDGNGNSANCTATISVLKDTALPQGWVATDIGTTALGSAEYDHCVNVGEFTLNSYGYTTNTSDVQHSAYRSLCGNGELIAQVANIAPQGGWGGIQMRESSSQGAKKFTIKTQLGSMLRRETRTTTFGSTNTQQSLVPAGHTWLRITRAGNTFTAYSSADGLNWVFRSAATIAMPDCVQMGLFVESINNTTATQAIFNHIIIGGGVQPLLASNDAGPENTYLQVDKNRDFALLKVYPNPTSSGITIDLSHFEGSEVQVEVYSLDGKLLQTQRFDEAQDTGQLDVSAWQKGMYVIKASSEYHQKSLVQRIVVQ